MAPFERTPRGKPRPRGRRSGSDAIREFGILPTIALTVGVLVVVVVSVLLAEPMVALLKPIVAGVWWRGFALGLASSLVAPLLLGLLVLANMRQQLSGWLNGIFGALIGILSMPWFLLLPPRRRSRGNSISLLIRRDLPGAQEGAYLPVGLLLGAFALVIGWSIVAWLLEQWRERQKNGRR